MTDSPSSVAALVEACLEVIEAREPEVGAWAALDPELVRRHAAELDRADTRGPLEGLPLGVKDVIETADLPTGCGSALYEGRRTGRDAAVVAAWRAQGGMVMGKTVTTELAGLAPAPTRNPHDPTRTPGGSSSGSAAAVAARMVPAAVGTQTAGSVIRPAAYCGIAGFKPTFGWLSTSGVSMWSWSLDTIGCFAPTVARAALVAGALAGRDWVPDPRPAAPRIGLLHTPWDDEADDGVVELVHDTVRALGPTEVRSVEVNGPVGESRAAQETIMAYEGARALAHERAADGGRLTPTIRDSLDAGARIPHDVYDAAQRQAAAGRAALDGLFGALDVLVTPAAPGVAPPYHTGSGDPVFCRAWTLLGTPTVNVPGLTRDGLPLGIQVVGRPGAEAATVAAAHWIEQALR